MSHRSVFAYDKFVPKIAHIRKLTQKKHKQNKS